MGMTHPLEPDREQMRDMAQAAADFVAGFVGRLPDAPANGIEPDASLRQALLAPPGDDPSDWGALLETFGAAAGQAVETAGPGYLAYIPGGGLFSSALAEFLARSVNRYTGLAGMAPDLVAMEHGVLQWLGREFGLPGTAGGLITTGGSMATLSAIVAARHDRLGEDFTGGTLYVTARTHHCVAKAARVAGFPAVRVRVVPVTEDLRMDPGAAARMIAEDRAAGLRPFFLVATAGSTDTGTVDPIRALGQLAAREDLWFHADGAYGGFFQLTERGRLALDGIGAADSIVLDPHKGLFLPYGTGVLLVRDVAPLGAAHSGGGSYLQDLDGDRGLPDFGALGPELTREFRGLRVWLPLRLHGVAAFRDALDEKLTLAQEAYRDLAADPRLEVPWAPDLSVVAFRLRDGGDDANLRLLAKINADGRIFTSSTRINARVTLRLSILSHRTHREHVNQALAIIHQAAGQA
jgi:aromatic-L-amino-acid decarboxylase